jgi:hypothetical protein
VVERDEKTLLGLANFLIADVDESSSRNFYMILKKMKEIIRPDIVRHAKVTDG